MGWLGSIFTSKKIQNTEKFNISAIRTDMHSHIIPGIDDGSRSLDESIAIINKFKSLGYRKLITTPHIMAEVFPNNRETIENGLNRLRNELDRIQLDIEIEAAAEYYFDDTFLKSVQGGDVLSFSDNYVLVEFSFHSEPSNEQVLFFEMQMKGYKPILAHFERYTYFDDFIEKAKFYRELGVNIQLNLNSLTGHYGQTVKKQAEKLIDNDLIQFVGTDCHRIQHLNLLESHLDDFYLSKLNGLQLKNQLL
jgi:tyrosine-protein phosphatase YwqE